ncbi:MAG: glycosyltransferase family 2 protein [Chloroflexi bacterium]|nr:glycosyltransferase family 2 protein [Chloroflexota bacterium]
MLTLIQFTYLLLSLLALIVGWHMLLFFPLSLLHQYRQRRPAETEQERPSVSIIVPAYNEAKVIGNCVRSILRSDYDCYEVILVNDGSSDDTLAQMQQFAAQPRVRVIDKPNGGKASALNAGIRQAHGDVLFFVDADGIFRRDTIRQMVMGFNSPAVGAVCGTDCPVNLDRLQTRLMVVQTHVTTGMVRRALAAINCLPIVSGNIGAFRRDVLEQIGYFRHGFIGEDLELTWRVHRAGYRVAFQPEAVVYAELPSTVKALWKQRVRWGRGLLQTAVLHRDMFFKPHYGLMALYLPLNVLSLTLIPILQLLLLCLLFTLLASGASPLEDGFLSFLGWLGFAATSFTTAFAIALNRAWTDLRYIYVLPLWIPYAFFLNFVMLWAFVLELRGVEAKWNKLERTGVISRRDTAL